MDENSTVEVLRRERNHQRPMVVIRGIFFFCEGQVVPLPKVRTYFTDYAISKFMDDGYIKWKDED